jgi:integrase/recombinase XerD
MGKLREEMRWDLRKRGLAESTIESYLRYMIAFVKHYRKSPDEIGLSEVKQYQRFLIEKDLAPNTINGAMAALRFFYTVTLKQEWKKGEVPWMKRRKKLPVVLSPLEIADLLNAVDQIKHRTILMTMYSSGLRINETVHLRAQDIDSKRMLIHIKFAKGGKDRQSLLSPILLETLRRYWKKNAEDKSHWLFPSIMDPKKTIFPTSIRRAIYKAKKKIGLKKQVSTHTFRHCFATHLMEMGIDLRVIQILLGHALISSTTRYTQLRTQMIPELGNPLDAISSNLKPF